MMLCIRGPKMVRMLGNFPCSGGIVVDGTIDARIGRHAAMLVVLKLELLTFEPTTTTSRPVL
jgi:hypothetical protein